MAFNSAVAHRLESADGQQCFLRGDDVLVMDPMRVTPGIEPSDDPILWAILVSTDGVADVRLRSIEAVWRRASRTAILATTTPIEGRGR